MQMARHQGPPRRGVRARRPLPDEELLKGQLRLQRTFDEDESKSAWQRILESLREVDQTTP